MMAYFWAGFGRHLGGILLVKQATMWQACSEVGGSRQAVLQFNEFR